MNETTNPDFRPGLLTNLAHTGDRILDTDYYVGVCKTCVRPVRHTVTHGQPHTPMTCPECGTELACERVQARVTFGKCDARCEDAYGPICACSCRGANHAGRWAYNTVTDFTTQSALDEFRAKAAKTQEKARRKAERARAQREEAFTAWATDNQDVITYLNSDARPFNTFLVDMTRLVTGHEILTERQAEAVRKFIARQDTQRDVTPDTRHAGQPGDKITVTGTVTRAVYVEGFTTGYGHTTMQVALTVTGTGDDTGIVITAFTGAQRAKDIANELHAHHTYGKPLTTGAVTITGAVKKHDVYQGINQTRISRPKIT